MYKSRKNSDKSIEDQEIEFSADMASGSDDESDNSDYDVADVAELISKMCMEEQIAEDHPMEVVAQVLPPTTVTPLFNSTVAASSTVAAHRSAGIAASSSPSLPAASNAAEFKVPAKRRRTTN